MILLTRVGQRYQVTIPKDVRQAVGLKAGDLVEARPGKGCIVLYPKVDSDIVDVDKRLAEAEADLKAGRLHGPFGSVEAMLASLPSRQTSHLTLSMHALRLHGEIPEKL